jgi:hypothetical protein
MSTKASVQAYNFIWVQVSMTKLDVLGKRENSRKDDCILTRWCMKQKKRSRRNMSQYIWCVIELKNEYEKYNNHRMTTIILASKTARFQKRIIVRVHFRVILQLGHTSMKYGSCLAFILLELWSYYIFLVVTMIFCQLDMKVLYVSYLVYSY